MPSPAAISSATNIKVGEPNAGDILLFADAHGVNKLITAITRSQYYRVAIYAGNDEIIEARPQGVTRRALSDPRYSHLIAVLPAPDSSGRAALGWAATQVGAPYDRVDLLVILLEHIFVHLRINYAAPGKYSCGEFVDKAFRHAGITFFPGTDSNDVVPADFAKMLPAGTQPRVMY